MFKAVRALSLILTSLIAISVARAEADLVQQRVASLNKVVPALVAVEAVAQPTAGAEIWDRITYRFENGKVILQYAYSPQVLANPKDVTGDLAYLNALVYSPIHHSHRLFELENLFNARHGSPGAQYYIFKKLWFDATIMNNESIKRAFDKRMKILAEAQKADFKSKQKAWETWKKQSSVLAALDKSPTKLDDLIRKNDRAGVRKLIEAYLPWPAMEPFETAAWKTWLEGLETKATPENSVVLFRGVKYDTDIPFFSAGGTPGFMSTVLTKNQGSYNRRLRSLATRRLTNGALWSQQYKDFAEAPSVQMTSQFMSHANAPQGSSFLSFTYSPTIAFNFIGTYDKIKNKSEGGLLAIRVPRNRIVSNILSRYTVEVEALIPLIVFPDDVLHYVETPRGGTVSNNAFIDAIRAKLTPQEITRFEINQTEFRRAETFTGEFFKDFNFILDHARATRCEGVF